MNQLANCPSITPLHPLQMDRLNSIKEVPHEIQAYWTFHEEFTIKDGLVLIGTRIAILKSKCKQVLTIIHKGHLGLGKYKL